MTRDELLELRADGRRAFGGVDLREANLCYADLSGIDLNRANLNRAQLDGAHLRGTDLRGAKLHNARLISANLRDADLRDADLRSANLSFAILGGANLSSANISDADLTAARVGAGVLANLDLRLVKGLESVRHYAPTSIGIDTILMSGGRIPDAFLRGCGVPDHIIAMQQSVVNGLSPVQFYSCFISFSTTDEEFARRLHGRLQQESLRVWFAPEDMKAGRKLNEQIDDAIRVHDKLLLVLSNASMKSEWVSFEIERARKRERKEGAQVLFPVRLVEYEALEEWPGLDAHEVRQYFIPDFSAWKDHDAFETAFARLLRDLKASAK